MSRPIVLSLFSLILAASLVSAQSQPVLTQRPQALPPEAQAAQPEAKPQTPRQALIEVITSKDSATLLKHLPKAAKTMLLEKGNVGSSFLLGSFNGGLGEMINSQGGKLDIPEAGPTLLTVEEPSTQSRAEVTIEGDDYRGDEDDMELALHQYKNGEEQFFPQIGRILLNLKLEDGIWKFAEVGYSIRLKLDDPKFLESVSKEIRQTQQRAGEGMAEMSMQAVSQAETAYLHQHGTYNCSIDELSASAGKGGEQMTPKLEAQMLNRYGYRLTLSDCTASSFKAAAEPVPLAPANNAAPDAATPKASAHRAFCSDQTAIVRSSADGQAQTCFSSGHKTSGAQEVRPRIDVVPAH